VDRAALAGEETMPPRDSMSVPDRRESRAAVAYFFIYLASLFVSLESEATHWITLVCLPLLIAFGFGRPGRSRGEILRTFGLRRFGWRKGVGWAIGLGLLVTILQVAAFQHRDEILALIRSGRALWLYPLTLVLMLGMAGFTEEFFFRGFLQTRLEALTRSSWLAIVIASVLFSLYHVPYAFLNPNWPSAGDWGLAFRAAFANGLVGGVVLGTLYVRSGRNLVPCILLHSMINAAPAMTLLRFGG
jgi:membrane protease YdiL (CAAX protease family)